MSDTPLYTTHLETIEVKDYDTKALLAKALGALPDKTYLTYINYDESFTDKNCQAIVSGQKDEVFEDGWDFGEGEWHAIKQYLEEALPDEEERKALEDSDEFEEFWQACYDRDLSTPYADVLRNTGRRPVRFYLRTRKGERIAVTDWNVWNWSDEQLEQEAKRFARLIPLDFTQHRAALRELVVNATYGGILCVMAYVEMRDVDKWVEHCLRHGDRARVRLTFTNPHLLLHDPWNGSGHDVQIEDKVTIRFGAGALSDHGGIMELDAKGVGAGYSWNEIAGPYWPAYQQDPEPKLYLSKKSAKPDHPAPESWPGR